MTKTAKVRKNPWKRSVAEIARDTKENLARKKLKDHIAQCCTAEKAWRSAKLLGFYILYFAFLAGLGVAALLPFQKVISPIQPYQNLILNVPGLNAFPKYNPRTDQKRAKGNDGVLYKWYSGVSESWQFYTDKVEAEKRLYDQRLANALNGTEKVKTFDWTTLDQCNNAPYGWDSNEPCIYFRINKVIGWEPRGLLEPVGFLAKDGNLPKFGMQRDVVYVRCESRAFEGGIKASGNSTYEPLTFEYFGGALNDGYIEKDFFPFLGRVRHRGYQPPIMALKVKGLKPAVHHVVKCHAFAANIVINDMRNFGSISFEMLYEGFNATSSV